MRNDSLVRKVRARTEKSDPRHNGLTGVFLKFNVRYVFVSTEDATVIEEVSRLQSEFRFYYTKVPRLNMSPFESAAKLGRMQEFVISWVQLLLAVQADIYVGTRSSNWCRLIDEIRKANGKAATQYLSPAGDQAYEL